MRRWPESWGWPAAAALGALAVAGLLGGVLAPRWLAQAEAAWQAQRQLRPPAPQRPPAAAPGRALPVAGDAAERVAALLRLALRHGVQVERTQQRISRQGGVQRLQVGLAARGRYAELRGFVAAALQADPALALDQLQWRRVGTDSDILEASLDWSLYEPAPPALDT